ncbi:RNA polymerase subunit sigma-70 [Conexibacter woesei]|uniref:RNA polymerase sigma factor n=1 Tax=Conexibacter woesei (strain DSM 14684 / CCUG 47730 / CIP 108061 / JCM 11494 / NBRC 100937 / ID131577) TaxID=469383 RepID=D3F726_CONWI|nr:RNA polymerase subunit sigma-70 [Conexibacter woesei]ADB48797.1 RNA polymerase, sigma-24 subunit, ECF subfamily [Conexibacter woesei DSM 14684]
MSTQNADFTARIERHRREIHVHCYRMLGSYEEAEDLVQETFLRAWDKRATFAGGSFRAWLYRIATNACLDALRRSRRRVPTLDRSFVELPWIQPYPDRLLDEVPSPEGEEPAAVVVARETIELAFLAVIQLLPARQRAVTILRDVLDWSAAETADALGISVAAANSALQRARATLAERAERERPVAQPSAYEQELLAAFIDMHERGDKDAALAVVREDIRVTMPPHPYFYEGIPAMRELLARAFDEPLGEWRLVPTRANRMPTAASYLRLPGDTVFRAFKFDVLRVEGDKIVEITTFGPELFGAFGLPLTLPSSSAGR